MVVPDIRHVTMSAQRKPQQLSMISIGKTLWKRRPAATLPGDLD